MFVWRAGEDVLTVFFVPDYYFLFFIFYFYNKPISTNRAGTQGAVHTVVCSLAILYSKPGCDCIFPVFIK